MGLKNAIGLESQVVPKLGIWLSQRFLSRAGSVPANASQSQENQSKVPVLLPIPDLKRFVTNLLLQERTNLLQSRNLPL